MSRSWTELLRSLGESLIGVAGAEAAALKGDLRASGRRFLTAVALAAAAASFCFWVVGAAGFVVFQVLSLWLPRWGAAAVVLALFLLLASILGMAARQRWRAVEVPIDTVRRHIDDHVAWWQDEVFVEQGQAEGLLAEGSRRESKEIPSNS